MTIARDAGFGPVDLYLLGLPTERPDPAALTALMDLVGTGLVRLLDLILISKAEDGALTLVEARELPDGFEIDAEMLGATGLLGQEDIAELAAAIPAPIVNALLDSLSLELED